jgi:hypothetical protein
MCDGCIRTQPLPPAPFPHTPTLTRLPTRIPHPPFPSLRHHHTAPPSTPPPPPPAPPPGTYALKTSSAFASHSARELQLHLGEVNNLGPAYEGYVYGSLGTDLGRSSRVHSSSFCSASPRFKESVSPTKPPTPGPGNYTPRKRTDYSTTRHYSNHASF